MSDSYDTNVASGTGVETTDSSGTLDTAKQEAAELKNTTTDQAKNVLGTAKDEAASVAGEVKLQAKDLFAQTQTELKDQAGTQQQRIAVGLRAVSDELTSMADNASGGGVAADLVRQVSTRLSGASTWLSDRDPGSVLTEVKRYARRKPGTFILGAAVAGILVGRLTRALAANAADDKAAAAALEANRPQPDAWAAPTAVVATPVATPVTVVEDTPIYTQSATSDGLNSEGGNVRSDSF